MINKLMPTQTNTNTLIDSQKCSESRLDQLKAAQSPQIYVITWITMCLQIGVLVVLGTSIENLLSSSVEWNQTCH